MTLPHLQVPSVPSALVSVGLWEPAPQQSKEEKGRGVFRPRASQETTRRSIGLCKYHTERKNEKSDRETQ